MLLAGSAHRSCRRLYGSNDSIAHPQRYQKAPVVCRQRNSSPAVAGWQPIITVLRQVTVKVAKPSSQASGDSNNADSRGSGSESPTEASQTPPTADNSSTAADSTLAPDLPASAASVARAADTPTVRTSDTSAATTTSTGVTGAAEDTGTPAAASLTGGGGSEGGRGRGGPGGGGGGAAPQSTVSLMTRFNGIGYTFVLAGFLKIVTLGGMLKSAPVGAARTGFGQASPYLMVPVALGLCWVAKQVIDTGLNESRRFMQYMVATLVLLYFALVKLMYKYEPDSEWVRRPRPRLPGQLADLRAQLGDKEITAGAGVNDSRSYMLEKPGKELYDDVAWYEGRYPSQLNAAAAGAEGPRRGRGSAVARLDARRAVAAASETEEEYGSASGAADLMRTREGVSAADADTNGTAVPVARVANRRSFLSDNIR